MSLQLIKTMVKEALNIKVVSYGINCLVMRTFIHHKNGSNVK